jgi:hypothetical protein
VREGTRASTNNGKKVLVVEPLHFNELRYWEDLTAIVGSRKTEPVDAENRPPSLKKQIRELLKTIPDNLEMRWTELCASELVLEGLSSEYDGIVPIHPELRKAIDGLKGKIRELCEALAPFGGKTSLEEPDEESLEQVRKLAHIED